MNIDEYLALQKFIEYPPAKLQVGNIKNLVQLYHEEDGEQHNDAVSIALGAFRDAPMYNRTYSFPEAESVTLYRYLPKKMVASTPLWPGLNTIHINGKEGQTHIDTILAMAEPAPYGDIPSGETIVNKDVRDCLQIPASHDDMVAPYTTHPKGWFANEVDDETKQVIAAKMYPGQNIKIKINKVNIYKTGGHFAAHVDTPKPGVIGTLVVFGSSEFEGGDLVLQNEGVEERYNSGMVAFYSNILHWVEPVISGHRVAVTYYILRDDEDEKINARTLIDEPNLKVDIERVPLKVLQTAVPFGVCLSETYSQGEVVQHRGGVRSYKGVDYALVEKLSPHFKLDDIPVILKYDESYYENCSESSEISAEVYRFKPADFVSYKDGTLSEEKLTQIPCYISQNVYGTDLQNTRTQYIDYVGNECQAGLVNNIYFNRLLIVTAPC